MTLLNTLSVPAAETRRRVNGVDLHVVEAGPVDGPLVLLLHGFPEFWWGWRRQIGALAAAGFRVVAPDQRGYNTSAKPQGVRSYDLDTLALDIVGLIDAFERRQAHVVGHDWGGLAAWWAASRHPDRVERLAILNAPHPAVVGPYMRRHPSQMAKSQYIAYFQLPWLPEAMLRRRDFAYLCRALAGSSRRGTFPREDLEPYKAAWRQPGALTGMLNWYRALRHKPSLPDARVRPPTLVLWGVRDLFLEAGLAEASLALCDSGRLLPFEDATHWVHLEEADRVNAELVAFFR